MPTQIRMVQQAYRVALDPTPRQERAFASHAGGARFAYNWGLAAISAALDAREAERAEGQEPTTPIPGHFDLCKAWTKWKDTAEWTDRDTGEVSTGVPWVGTNFSGTYQAALRDAAKAWQDYFSSRTGQRKGRSLGKPRFKSKRGPARFQTHGGVRLDSATRVRLPVIGSVRVLSDDSHHPAMARSRKHTPGQRHMGNRRRSRTLWDTLRKGEQLRAQALTILDQAHNGADPDQILATLNHLADERARAAAVSKAHTTAHNAKDAAAAAWQTVETVGTDKARKAAERAQTRAGKAQERLEQKIAASAALTANAKDRWSARKLDRVVTTGELTPTSAADLAHAYDLNQAQTALLEEAALQPRIIRASISKGADGLWWASLGCEVPEQVRTAPSYRQQQRGHVGVDLGVRSTATLSQRLGGRRDIPNPTPLEKAQGELRQAQRHLSRTQQGSARHARAKARVGLIHAGVARLREQHLHRATTRLARAFAGIAVEGHDLQKLAQNGSVDLPRALRNRRNRALADASAGSLRQMLHNKISRTGATLVVAEAGMPTGRTCARCGAVKTKPVPPWYEVFSCDACGTKAPRRVNTARVLQLVSAGSGSLDGGSAQSRGGDVSPGRPSGSDGQSSTKRAARSRSPGRGQTGTPGP